MHISVNVNVKEKTNSAKEEQCYESNLNQKEPAVNCPQSER